MKKIIGRLNPEDSHVTIWGAGFAGLVLGYYLKSKGYRLTIYERSNRAGGKIQTKKTSFGPVETAANALFLNPDGLELLHELKLEPLPATKKLRRLLLLGGKPRSPFKLALLSKLAIKATKRPPLISDGLSVADFFRPLLGQEVIDQYLSPVLGGVYATTAESLHFKSLFDQVEKKSQFESYWEFIKTISKPKHEFSKGQLKGSVSFEGGMQALIDRLAEELKSEIRLNYKERFRIKRNTIICTDALSAAELLQELRPEMAAELRRIRYQKLSSSTVFLKREIKTLRKAFGVLIPQTAKYKSSGILNNKAIFPANNENIFSYTFIGRNEVEADDIHHDLRLIWPGLETEDIEHIEITNWARAIPIYDLQRYLSVKRLHELAQKEDNLVIFGNYVAGISLRDMITAAKDFVFEKTGEAK